MIGASQQSVWAVLSDLDRWPEWESGVTAVQGHLARGEKVSLTAAVNPGRAFRVKVAELEEPQRIVLRGGMPFGLFTGERTYTLESEGAATRFRMREHYTGPIAGAIFKSIPDLSGSFQQFADGLKAKAEGTQRTGAR